MLPPDFEEAVEWVLEEEGGETNDPEDPGGHTKYGISQRAHPNVDLATLSRSDAKGIYRTDYWTPLLCSRLPRGYALAAFDFGVRTGVGNSAKYLQSTVGTNPDGIVGAKTIAAAWLTTSRVDRLLLSHIFFFYKNSGEKFKVGEALRTLRLRDLIRS